MQHVALKRRGLVAAPVWEKIAGFLGLSVDPTLIGSAAGVPAAPALRRSLRPGRRSVVHRPRRWRNCLRWWVDLLADLTPHRRQTLGTQNPHATVRGRAECSDWTRRSCTRRARRRNRLGTDGSRLAVAERPGHARPAGRAAATPLVGGCVSIGHVAILPAGDAHPREPTADAARRGRAAVEFGSRPLRDRAERDGVSNARRKRSFVATELGAAGLFTQCD